MVLVIVMNLNVSENRFRIIDVSMKCAADILVRFKCVAVIGSSHKSDT